MKQAIRSLLWEGQSDRVFSVCCHVGCYFFSLAGWTADEHSLPDLTAHEWGTSPQLPVRRVEPSNGCLLGCHDTLRPPIYPNFWSISNGVNFKPGAAAGHHSHGDAQCSNLYSPRDVDWCQQSVVLQGTHHRMVIRMPIAFSQPES